MSPRKPKYSELTAQVAAARAVTVKEPHDLRALLAVMKSAKAQRVNMAIWDRDIATVQDAIDTIDAIRALRPSIIPV